MAYGLKYSFSFVDEIYESPATFRIEIEQKDYVGSVTLLPFLDESPVVLERTSAEDNKLTPIVGTKLTIKMVYNGDDSVPHPTTFKDIQEDTYRVNVYKNDVINFRGFIKPDAAKYPLSGYPFRYTINATDYFNGMKGKLIDLNVSESFYYGLISFADFIGRTVFNAVDYTDAIINVLFKIQPKEMDVTKNILGGIYVHTDSFYSLEDGPMSIYDALTRFLKAFRARVFFSAGTYWIQRISDLYYPYTEVIQYAYPLSIDTNFPIAKSHQNYETDFQIIEDSGEVSVSPAIYQQKANYKLKGLNQLENFAWLQYTLPTTLTDWDVNFISTMDRIGAGSADNPFLLRLFDQGTPPGTPNIMQLIGTIQIGQRVQVQLRIEGHNAKDMGIGVLLGSTTDPDNAYALDAGGNWIHLIEGSTSRLYFPVAIPKSGKTGVDIISQPVPTYAPNAPDTELSFYIVPPRPIDGGAPPGDNVYVDIYPAFLRIFVSSTTDMESTTTNDKRFSYIPDKEELFFLDTEDELLSNTVFTDNGTSLVPVPLNDWMDDGLPLDKTLDYLAGQTIIDNFNKGSNVLEAEIRSNTLEFYQNIVVEPIDSGVTLMQLSDSYDLKSGIHKVVAEQIFPKAYGDGTYTIKSVINS